jgi:hypothetical protein
MKIKTHMITLCSLNVNYMYRVLQLTLTTHI